MIESHIKTADVFVPGLLPTVTYNPRDDLKLEEKLGDYLEDGGTVLALVGPTKTGKSVLLKRVLDGPVWIEGQAIKSVEDFWQLIGSQLSMQLTSTLTTSSASSSEVRVEGGIPFLTGGGGVSDAESESTSVQVISALSSAVSQGLLESRRGLVIDDFHFVDRDTQREVVRAVKPLVFAGLRVVLAAISHRQHDVPNVVEDMVGRVSPLRISLWTKDELEYIATSGFKRLNVTDPGGTFGRKLAEASFGSPHIMQKLCREFVRSVNGVREARDEPLVLQEPDSWDEFFRSQVDDASGRWFAKLLRGPQEKGQQRSKWRVKESATMLDNYGLVLQSIAKSGPQLELTRDEIRSGIDKNVIGKPPEAHQVTRALQHMSRIAATRLDDPRPSESELEAEALEFAGVQPVLEFIGEGPGSTLHIADPFFAYYLRWGSDQHLKSDA